MIVSEKTASRIVQAAGLHSPEQRLFLGVTALATQPFIDLNNKKADEDTRILSTCRTIAKIIAGTTSGVVVRAGCIELVKLLTKTTENGKGPGIDKNAILSPRTLFETVVTERGNVYRKKLESYQKTLGTAAAIGVMLFTNFLWDSPVTKKLTNFFYEKATEKDSVKK